MDGVRPNPAPDREREHVVIEGTRVYPIVTPPTNSWSSGAVTDPTAFYARTMMPERGGVRCARVFGPFIELSCLCGKYRGAQYRGITCEKCGVLVESARVRGERFGHIALAAPVPHPWLEDAVIEESGLDRASFDAVYAGSAVMVDGAVRSVASSMDDDSALDDGVRGPWSLREHTERSHRASRWIDVIAVLPPALRENVDDFADVQPDLDALSARAREEGWGLERETPEDVRALFARPRAMDALLVEVVRCSQRLRESIEDEAPLVLRAFEASQLREATRALFGTPSNARRSGRRLRDLCAARVRAAQHDASEPALAALDRTLFAAGFARTPPADDR